jgi:hypothetical protein
MPDDFSYPAHSPLTVLSADDPKLSKVGFRIYERQGVTVRKSPDDETPLSAVDPLPDGMHIFVPALVGGYHRMVVRLDEKGWPYGEGVRIRAILGHANDERGRIWVCLGLINNRGLAGEQP